MDNINNRKLDIQWFIEQHSDWEKLLSEKPYCITISRDVFNGQNLIMLKYNQVDSDFNIKLVRECRGIIFDEDTWKPVSVPFFKFGNAGESYCPDIDWSSVHVGQKVDGSLVKVVNVGDNLLISTNGTILASNAPVAEQIGCKYQSFGDIVADVLDDVLEKSGWQKKLQEEGLCALWKEGYTYMFELCSPWTRVVVPHKENKLYFLGKRNNETFEETYFTDDPVFSTLFDTPKVYPLKSIDECLTATKEMPWNEEGYVVCDRKFNRVKVKSPAYCAIHHMKGNGKLSYERGIDIVRSNEISEVVTYFPEFKNHLDGLKEKLKQTLSFLDQAWANYLIMDSKLVSRKDKAIEIQRLFKSFSGIGFALLDHKINSPKEWLETCPSNKLVKFLGYKD